MKSKYFQVVGTGYDDLGRPVNESLALSLSGAEVALLMRGELVETRLAVWSRGFNCDIIVQIVPMLRDQPEPSHEQT